MGGPADATALASVSAPRRVSDPRSRTTGMSHPHDSKRAPVAGISRRERQGGTMMATAMMMMMMMMMRELTQPRHGYAKTGNTNNRGKADASGEFRGVLARKADEFGYPF